MTMVPSEEIAVFNKILDSANDYTKSVIAERDALKAQLFEARQALLKEGMRADALQKKIDSGVRFEARKLNHWFYGPGFILSQSSMPNSVLIIDKDVDL